MPTTLAGCVIVEDGEVLLLQRRDEGHWELPGGKVEDDELPRHAAAREAREELGCEVQVQAPYGRMSVDFRHDEQEYTVRVFTASIVDGTPHPVEDKFTAAGWFDDAALLDLDLAPNLQATLDGLRLLLRRSPGKET